MRLLPEQSIQVLEQRTAPGEHDALVDDVGGELRRRALERDAYGLDDAGDRLGERLAPLTARIMLGADTDTDLEPASLTIAGTEGMVVSYAKCCYPIPGDNVMGYMSRGRGVVIHRTTCRNLANFQKHSEKWISVSWENHVHAEFPSLIHVETINKPGVLAEVTRILGALGISIEAVIQKEPLEDQQQVAIILLTRRVQEKHMKARAISPAVMKVMPTPSRQAYTSEYLGSLPTPARAKPRTASTA